MALIKCSECGRDISDKASACPGCGAPVAAGNGAQGQAPQPPAHVGYNSETDNFSGTMAMVVKLAMRAIQQLGWKIDDANENLGFITFQTGISWGSWSGISGSISIEELEPGSFKASGAGKQNIRGGQLVALNIGGEAQGKARKAINLMKELANQGNRA
ncbi:MAG: zinc ribbon domain-containing protein [Proteobacteria bacterium]|nr:zinc ribbon domain-containing protein [Pseudomonadota bacterium]